MKKILCVALSLCLSSLSYAQVDVKTDNLLFESAIKFFDNGNVDKAIEIFNGLQKSNPGNANVRYELALCHYSKGDFNKAIGILKKLIKDSPNPRVYTLYGNCLDDMGKTKKAIEMYDEGLELYPNSGQLYLEKGVINLKANNYEEAFSCFKKGVDAEPGFSSNHFRIAQLNLESQRPFLGLVSGEVHSLLSPSSERTDLISGWMFTAFQQNVKVDGDSVKVLLSRDIQLPFNPLASDMLDGMQETLVEMLYTDHFSKAAGGCYESLKKNGKLSLMDIVEFRRRILNSDGRLKYNNEKDNVSSHMKARVYLRNNLITYQKKVLAAGHWEAYNMWLFRMGNEAEFNAWYERNKDKFDAFVEWFNNEDNAFSVSESYGKE